MDNMSAKCDSIRIGRLDAVELVIHHLRLACMFFETTPTESHPMLIEEMKRQMSEDGDAWTSSAEAFINKIDNEYEEMKKDD